MSTVLIRRIDKKDISAVAQCEARIFADASSAGAIDALFDMGAIGVLAEKDGEICGYAYCADALGEAELLRIAVMPELRGEGLGAAILKEMHIALKENGISRVLLEVRESNLPARTLYKSFGYREDGKRRNFYSNPREDAVLMSKDIDASRTE